MLIGLYKKSSYTKFNQKNLLDLVNTYKLIKILYQILAIVMSDLLERLQHSKLQAVSRGSIIKLRKQDVTRQKVVGQNHKITYTWYQTPAKVGIQIPHTVENKNDLHVEFQEDRVTIDFPIPAGGHYHLDLSLFGKIIPPRSKAVHRLDSIEIIMEKMDRTESWPYLRKDGLGITEAQEGEKISYPTSSKTKKNWDKIDRQIEGEVLKHGEEFGVDPGMAFFKEIFSNADPEKRRAMMKSFQTSGGTVLSTDWGDVAKKDYQGKDRPSPPKGQEWKKRQI